MVDVYCEVCKPKMKAVSLESGSKALSTAVYKSVINKGEAKVMKGNDNVIIYTYKSDARITAVIANKVWHWKTSITFLPPKQSAVDSGDQFLIKTSSLFRPLCDHPLQSEDNLKVSLY